MRLKSVCKSLVSALLLLSLLSINIYAAPSDNKEGALSSIVRIPVGEGANHAQVITNVEGGTPMGPESLTVGPDGTIYVLDSIQSQVIVVRNNEIIESISLPFATMPRDILVHEDKLFVLDSNAVVFEVGLDGKLIEEHPLPNGLGSMSVHRLTISDGEIVLWTENYAEISLDAKAEFAEKEFSKSKDRGVQNIDGKKLYGEAGDFKSGHIKSQDGSVNIDILTEQAFGSVSIIGFDAESNIYALVEELADPSPVIATEVTLRRYDKKGQMTGVVAFPDFVKFPAKPAEVTEAGDAYLLVPTEDAVIVYKAVFGRSYKSRLPEIRERAVAAARAEAITSALSTYLGSPVTRATARTRAYNMTTTSWTWKTQYDTASNGNTRSYYTATKPVQLPTTAGTSLTGIPYLWGGWDSQYSYTDGAPWSTWATALTYYSTNGPIVGDTSSSGTTLLSGLGAGIDCSGFVASAANVYSYSGGKPGTVNIVSDAISVTNTSAGTGFVSFSGMQPMDIFVKSGDHVLFYDYRANDGTGIYTTEATVGYGNISGDSMQGAKKYLRKWSELSGYSHKTWWSKATGDDFNNAATATGASTIIRGQMKYYKYTYASSVSGTVTVSATASSGDPDVYVYNSSYGLSGSSTTVGTSSYSFTATPYSTYYFGVYGYGDTSYTISY